MSSRAWGALALAAAAVGLLVVGGAAAQPLLTIAITGYPSDPTASTDATFSFSADARTATFTCSLDGARATPCTSPTSYGGLALGTHKFVLTAVSGRERASLSHTWRIEAPKPKTAPVLVTVLGGGVVTGAGLACPPDCSEAYPIGAQVSLSAKPNDGFAFSNWGGACGGGGACEPTVNGPTYVGARFVATSKVPGFFRLDSDRDGLADRADLCPGSHRTQKLVLHGCALSDLMSLGPALIERLEGYDWPGMYAERFDGVGLKPVRRDLLLNIGLMRKGADQVADGDVCDGAATLGRGARGLRLLVGKSKRLIGALQASLAKKHSGLGDTDEKDLEWAGLNYRQGIVEDIAASAGRARKSYGAACASLGKPVTLEGVVEQTDDAHGVLRLANGLLVQLPTGKYGADVFEGARLRVTGRRGPGGVIYAESTVGLDPDLAKLIPTPCVSLLIAPVQPFSKPNPILHSPRGYESEGVLQLEQGVRLGATPEQCDDAAGSRYSISVEASAANVPKFTVAPDLVAADDPVPLPLYNASKLWTLTVTHRKQGNNCPPASEQPQPQPLLRTPASVTKSYPCPVVVVGTTTYQARVRGFGSYATAVYDKTAFDLESNAFAVAKVTSLSGVHATLSSPSFEADGYAITGTQSAAFMSKIVKNQSFAVWPESWYGFPYVFPLESAGVGNYAALVWPRVVGTRHGRPYRYATKLPAIVSDLLPNCPAGNCFYRLPWENGVTVGVGQGNGPGAFSHNGAQQYAFDWMSDQMTIYATRGGVVGDVVESNTQNFNPCADNDMDGTPGDPEDKLADGPSNFVRIDHQDGTFSYYAHVDTNSVTPAEGTNVDRGDPIAKVGNIGRSCGPHLHYQVAIDSTNTIYGQTKQICFEGWALVIFDYLYSSCFVPKTSNLLISTNG